jgi:hypothetical protein
VVVTTVAGVSAELDAALQVVPDEPHAVRLDPAAIAVSGSEDYTNIPLGIYGQFLGPPGAEPGTAAAAQIDIAPATGRGATANATLGNQGELRFTLPTDLPVPDPEQSSRLTLDVTARRGDKRAESLRLTVELVHAPVLDSPPPQELSAAADLTDRAVSLTGQYLTDPVAASGGPAVASMALPILVQLSVPGSGPFDPIPARRELDTRISFSLPTGIPPLAAAEERWCQVAVKRGVLTSNTVNLILKGTT